MLELGLESAQLSVREFALQASQYVLQSLGGEESAHLMPLIADALLAHIDPLLLCTEPSMILRFVVIEVDEKTASRKSAPLGGQWMKRKEGPSELSSAKRFKNVIEYLAR